MIKRLTLEVPVKTKDGKEVYDMEMQKEIPAIRKAEIGNTCSIR
ncbi:MAG: hypothetical protein QW478_15595 [Candidatus Micrarchaeaceae archaeon]